MSRIGRGAKVPHLSYVGDAQVGAGVNVGAGSITVERHHFTANGMTFGFTLAYHFGARPGMQ